MLYKTEDGLQLAAEKVVFTRNGVEQEKPIGAEGKEWWLDFEQKWDDMEIVKFEAIEYSQEELGRFEEVKNIKANESALEEYIKTGEILDSPDLQILKLQKENAELKQVVADLTEEVLLGG